MATYRLCPDVQVAAEAMKKSFICQMGRITKTYMLLNLNRSDALNGRKTLMLLKLNKRGRECYRAIQSAFVQAGGLCAALYCNTDKPYSSNFVHRETCPFSYGVLTLQYMEEWHHLHTIQAHTYISQGMKNFASYSKITFHTKDLTADYSTVKYISLFSGCSGSLLQGRERNFG